MVSRPTFQNGASAIKRKVIPLHKTAWYRTYFVQKIKLKICSPWNKKFCHVCLRVYNQYGSESNADVRAVVLSGGGGLFT
jgi:hypothetical protein